MRPKSLGATSSAGCLLVIILIGTEWTGTVVLT